MDAIVQRQIISSVKCRERERPNRLFRPRKISSGPSTFRPLTRVTPANRLRSFISRVQYELYTFY